MRTATQAIPVREMSQAGQVRRAASMLAERIGFDEVDTGRVGLVATEAATNLVKHARGGEIVLSSVREPEAKVPAVEIVAIDRGPGIPDPGRALEDGYSTSGSMGGGLGAIRRNSSCFDLYSSTAGTILFSRIGGPAGDVAPPGGSAAPGHGQRRIEVGAITVPYPGETVCGDAWTVAVSSGRRIVLVADGLGHGVDASAAASRAAAVFAEIPDQGPAAILERVHEGLKGTRGAAAAVLELDPSERRARFAGIGNIAASIRAEGDAHSMVSHHGVLGHLVQRFHEFVYPWPPGALVVLHSDGIATHWDLARYPGLDRRCPALVAAALYRDFSRGRDDATVVVLREAA